MGDGVYILNITPFFSYWNTLYGGGGQVPLIGILSSQQRRGLSLFPPLLVSIVAVGGNQVEVREKLDMGVKEGDGVTI